jgi:nucleotide-binding universal stress UspA family protein
MFSKILIAYDGSPTSRSALEQAYELAEAEDADVTVVTVAPTVAPLAALAPVSVEGLRDELDQWARTKLAEAKDTAPADLTVHTIERTGHVGEEIVAEIESGDYDLVVLGSRGHGRLTTEILGSVNNHVHYHSDVPTLTIDKPQAAGGRRESEEVAVEIERASS